MADFFILIVPLYKLPLPSPHRPELQFLVCDKQMKYFGEHIQTSNYSVSTPSALPTNLSVNLSPTEPSNFYHSTNKPPSKSLASNYFCFRWPVQLADPSLLQIEYWALFSSFKNDISVFLSPPLEHCLRHAICTL